MGVVKGRVIRVVEGRDGDKGIQVIDIKEGVLRLG